MSLVPTILVRWVGIRSGYQYDTDYYKDYIDYSFHRVIMVVDHRCIIAIINL
jgi:hypothetical protein